MNVLVACERSGTIGNAFRRLGHRVITCDIQPSDFPRYHYQGDVRDILHLGFDMMIGNPPCTYLCLSGVRWLYTEPGRIVKMYAAYNFFMELWNCSIPRICLENSLPHKHVPLPPYTQIIQPYEHAHTETKKTCLWLKNLPKLEPRRIMKVRNHSVHEMSPGPGRSDARSKTFYGIARTMAETWGSLDG